MPIYRLDESVKYYNTVNTYFGYQYSYYGGNMFESLASTNPELFNIRKLRQINESRNIVRDFNDYFYDMLSKDISRLNAHYAKYEEGDPDEYRYFTQDFNQSIYTCILNDIKAMEDEGISQEAIISIITRQYLPDSLSEEGIKRLIRIRILNNKILIGALLKMLEDNYTMLNISTVESEQLAKGLKSKNSELSIAKIRDMLNDPEVIKRFKVGNNYDFRPIGGACMFMAHDIDIEGGQPSKYLSYIFKYDAIVISHGSESKNERLTNPLSAYVFNTNKSALRDILHIIKSFYTSAYAKSNYPELGKKSKNVYEKLNKLYNKSKISYKELHDAGEEVSRLTAIINDLYNETGDGELFTYYDHLDFTYQVIYSKEHIGQNMIDGKSSNWTAGCVDTLTKKNLNHVIDIVRALKKEGFKNVMLIVCNPGHIELPLDIKLDPSFHVTMGTETVLKEQISINEGLIDSLNNIASSISSYMKNMIDNCTKAIRDIKDRCKSMLRRSQKAFNRSMNINVIEIDRNKASFKTTTCKDYTHVERTVIEANRSIERKITDLIDDTNRFIAAANKRLRSSYNENSIFDDIDLL